MTNKITRRAATRRPFGDCCVPGARARRSKPAGTITSMHGFTPGGNVDITARLIAERLGKRARPAGDRRDPSPAPAAPTAAARGRARGARRADAVPRCRRPRGVGRDLQQLSYNALDGFILDQHAVGLSVHARHLSRSSGEDHRRDHRDGEGRSGQADSAPRRATAPASISRSELFAATAGIKIQHVPYRGSPQAITDLLAKRVDFQVDTPQVLLPFLADKRLRPIAITGTRPFFALPGVPTIESSGLSGYSVTGWLGIAGPAGLPPAFVSKINTEVRAILAEQAVIERLRQLGADLTPTTSEAFKVRVVSDIAKWTKVINDANIPKV